MSTPAEDFRYGLVLLEYDWLSNARATRLHHAEFTDEQVAEYADAAYLEDETVRLTCGRTLRWPQVPGLGDRMGTPRCHVCCHRVGYPQGVGSPKNDETLHDLARARIDARIESHERNA